jgi:hypothetical protein
MQIGLPWRVHQEVKVLPLFFLFQSAQKRWRRLSGAKYLNDILEGVEFQDGIRVEPEVA